MNPQIKYDTRIGKISQLVPDYEEDDSELYRLGFLCPYYNLVKCEEFAFYPYLANLILLVRIDEI